MGVQHCLKFTRHLLPLASSSPAQRKFLLHLSSFLIAHLSIVKHERKNVAIAVRTELIRVSRPVLFRSLPFHGLTLPAALSIIGCNSARVDFLLFSGKPSYWQGNKPSFPSKSCKTSPCSSSLHRILNAMHFPRLFIKPEISPNLSRIL